MFFLVAEVVEQRGHKTDKQKDSYGRTTYCYAPICPFLGRRGQFCEHCIRRDRYVLRSHRRSAPRRETTAITVTKAAPKDATCGRVSARKSVINSDVEGNVWATSIAEEPERRD